MTGLFADKTKFKKLKSDPTLTQLTTLQNYLRTIYNRREITSDAFSEVKPQSTKPARAHGLPRTHKDFDTLPPFRPIIDTTGTAYQPIAKYLTRLLNPLNMNSYTLKDSFEAVSRIQNIPEELFKVAIDLSLLMSNHFLQTSPSRKPSSGDYMTKYIQAHKLGRSTNDSVTSK
jgi:hypothetical protein